MQPLPIDASLPEITGALERQGRLVLVAPPGAGKTTRVPPAIFDSAFASNGQIVVLQPRRIAARAAACRMAEERGWTLGNEVGYQVRFENRCTPRTRIRVVTEGILIRQLQQNPFLETVSTVVLDEFHERSLHADLALAFLREIRSTVREDLRIVVMSATLDTAPVSEFLGGSPVIELEERPFPVDVRYQHRSRREPLHGSVEDTVRAAWSESEGHILVFLPGIAVIRRTARALESFAHGVDARVVPLHSSLTLAEQQAALSPSGRRKIILSTNIAETSVTIDGVDLVIDSGLVRLLKNDPRHGIDRLETERVSQYSAKQRAGRAGRLGPGRAIRLWSAGEQASLPRAPLPEIRRVDLASTILELRAWGVRDPGAFGWFEAPGGPAIRRAEALLASLGALSDENGTLTETGKMLLALPTHPRVARILLAASDVGRLKEGAVLAALLEERDIVRREDMLGGGAPRDRQARDVGPSDLLHRLDLYQEAEEVGFRRGAVSAIGCDPQAVLAVRRLSKELSRAARETLRKRSRVRSKKKRSGEPDDLLRALLSGYPDRVARRRQKGSDRGRMVGGRGVVLAPESVVRDGEFFLALDVDESVRGERHEARVRLASRVERAWIEDAFPESVQEMQETSFDEERGKVQTMVTVCYRDLPLEASRQRKPSKQEVQALLEKAARERAEAIVMEDDAACRWITRIRCLAAWMPELDLPRFTVDELEDLVARAAVGKSQLADIGSGDLLRHLKGALQYEQLRAVDVHAPETITVPSGSQIRLGYEEGKPPILAVRLQEMFGLAETPRVAAGRVPVLLHLLGPNFRAVQVTQDLENFWNETYAQVRKDLRGRYPKHHWPEDPWSAEPVRGAKRRKR